MKILDGSQAFENLATGNAHSRWNAPGNSADFALTANARLGRSAFVAEYETDLRIGNGDKVFCIGSCFARNVEIALRHYGITVESGAISGNALVTADTFNIYNTESMLNELRWSLDPAYPFNPDSLLPDREGYIDPHTSLTGVRTAERCLELRRDIIATTRRLKDCKFLVITLGLVEAWFDRQQATYLNVRPPRALVKASPGRFELHQLGYEETRRALTEIVRLLKLQGRPDAQLVLTVSPVPFQATFSTDDVVVANTYSKSVLRIAAQDFAAANDNVTYVPVYDSIVNTNPAVAWDEDRIHVTQDVVRLNITNFLSKTLIDPSQRQAARAAHLEVREALSRRSPVSRSPMGDGSSAKPFQRGAVPDFDLDESSDRRAFPSGVAQLAASSSLSDEFGPHNLMSGEVVPWHAAPDAAFPHTIDLVFATPLRAVRLWIQCQERFPERAPTEFVLVAGADGVAHEQTPIQIHHWKTFGEWASFTLDFTRAWPQYRMVILKGGTQPPVTMQRLWLEPETWAVRNETRVKPVQYAMP